MKRVFDITLVLLAMPILVPIYILVALLVKIKLGSHAVGWRVLDLEKWIDSKQDKQTLTKGGQKDVL